MMQTAAKKRIRRNYFINKDLQGKYTFYFFMIVTVGSILFTLIFSLLAQDTLTIVYKDNNLQLGKTPDMLITDILKAHWIFIILSGIVLSVLSIFLTHRFAGPIYRFERSVDEMTRGNLDFTITLRKHDAGKELAKMINTFTAVLSAKIVKLKELSGIVDANLPVLSGSDQALGAVRASNAQIKSILDGFTTKNKKQAPAAEPPAPAPVAAGLVPPGGEQDFLAITTQVKELAASLEEILDMPGMTHLVNNIDKHLSKFSPVMHADTQKMLQEAAALIRQTKEIDDRLKTIMDLYTRINR